MSHTVLVVVVLGGLGRNRRKISSHCAQGIKSELGMDEMDAHFHVGLTRYLKSARMN